jgi:hypothetical protein
MKNSSDASKASGTRSEPRYDASLPFKASLNISEAAEEGAQPQQRSVTLTGYTSNVSEHGLAVVGPFIRLGYRYLIGQRHTLEIRLELPTGTVEIKAMPVHFRELPPGEEGEGYILTGAILEEMGAEINCLIGLQITEISEENRARYNMYIDYLKAVNSGK